MILLYLLYGIMLQMHLCTKFHFQALVIVLVCTVRVLHIILGLCFRYLSVIVVSIWHAIT